MEDISFVLLCKKNEKEFFQKNINPDKLFSSPWRQFWILMGKGEYKQFKDEELKHKILRRLILVIIYSIIFYIAVASLIGVWTIKGS